MLVTGVEISKAQQQPLEMSFRHLTLQDGLSQSTINDIYQDETGYIWIATVDGINRYDGKEFISFKSEIDNPNSMSSGFVNSLDADSSGYLWASTNYGVSRLNLKTHDVKRYLHDSEDPNSLSNNATSHLIIDSKETLWVTTVNGLNRYVAEQDHFEHFESEFNLSYVFEDHAGTLWVGTEGQGLMQFNREKQELVRYHNFSDTASSLSNDTVNEIIEDDKGKLWIGTTNGLKRISADREEIRVFTSDSETQGTLSDNDVRSLFQDSKGRMWIGTENGLNLYDHASDRFHIYQHDSSDPQSLIGNRVSAIYEDNQNILWIGNWTGGINLYNTNTKGFAHYKNGDDFQNGTSDGNVWSFWEDGKQNIWFGTNGGLNLFDPVTQEFETDIAKNDNNELLSSSVIIDMMGGNNDDLWLSTTQGLIQFNIDDRTYRNFTQDPDDPSSLSHDVLLSVFAEDNGNTVWVGTAGSGLDKLNRETGSFRHYKANSEDSTSLSGENVSVIYRDQKGILWIGTYTGLNRYVEETDNFVQYREDIGDTTTISSSLISSIYEDSKGRLWVGTANGLNRYHRDKETFTYYTEKDGMADNTIYGITEDSHGNLYLSTNFGLSKFDPEEETFFNFDARDGLQDNEFNIGAAMKSSAGRMYFGGINGFNVFHPDSIKRNMHKPPVVLTDFELFNRSVPVGEYNGRTYLQKNISYTDNLTLSYKDDVFSFEFAALNYAIPEKNQFAYKMEGFEEDWNYVGSRNFATYTDLSPGDYTFRVKAANNDGVWNEEGIALSITIVPPFWQTTWFYLLSALLVIGIIFTGYWIRVRGIKEYSKRLEKEVADRTSDLDKKNKHLESALDELKKTRSELLEKAHKAGMADLATGVLHNIGNILNSVNISTTVINDTLEESKIPKLMQANDLLREHQDNMEEFLLEDPRGIKLLHYYLKLNDPMGKEYEKLQTHCNRLKDKVQLMLEVIDAQQDFAKVGRINEKVQLEQIVEDTLTLQAGSIERHDLDIQTEFGDTDKVSVQKSKLIHILINLFGNAKDAMTENNIGEKKITIRTYQEEEKIYLSISDNGEGVNEENINKIFNHGFTTKKTGHGYGLHTCANYMTEMGGNIEVKSEGKDKGATFILCFQNGKDEET